MKTFGNIKTKELVSLTETTPYGFNEPGYYPEQLCPPGKYHLNDDRAPWNEFHNSDPNYWKTEYPQAWAGVALDDPSAPWNKAEPNRDPSVYLDENGEALYWETPTLIPLVKKDKPDYDILTEYVQPKLVWFNDRVERQWEILPIPEKDLLDRASAEAVKAAKEAQAAKLQILYADYQVVPEGFSLATKESDQNAFTRLLTLVNTSGAPDNSTMSIADSSGAMHVVTVGRLKEILVAYGLEIFSRWQAYNS